jgi:hypothetical protein
LFFYLAQVVGLQFFINQNRNHASDFWGAKHVPKNKSQLQLHAFVLGNGFDPGTIFILMDDIKP